MLFLESIFGCFGSRFATAVLVLAIRFVNTHVCRGLFADFFHTFHLTFNSLIIVAGAYEHYPQLDVTLPAVVCLSVDFRKLLVPFGFGYLQVLWFGHLYLAHSAFASPREYSLPAKCRVNSIVTIYHGKYKHPGASIVGIQDVYIRNRLSADPS